MKFSSSVCCYALPKKFSANTFDTEVLVFQFTFFGTATSGGASTFMLPCIRQCAAQVYTQYRARLDAHSDIKIQLSNFKLYFLE